VLRTVAAREGLGQRVNGDLDESMSNLWEVHQQDTYLHAVATEAGLRLDEHLNELVERPPLASLTDGTALTATALRETAGRARGPDTMSGPQVCAGASMTSAANSA
jgi:hypothetical protein